MQGVVMTKNNKGSLIMGKSDRLRRIRLSSEKMNESAIVKNYMAEHPDRVSKTLDEIFEERDNKRELARLQRLERMRTKFEESERAGISDEEAKRAKKGFTLKRRMWFRNESGEIVEDKSVEIKKISPPEFDVDGMESTVKFEPLSRSMRKIHRSMNQDDLYLLAKSTINPKNLKEALQLINIHRQKIEHIVMEAQKFLPDEKEVTLTVWQSRMIRMRGWLRRWAQRAIDILERV
jgi:hypothetical protein